MNYARPGRSVEVRVARYDDGARRDAYDAVVTEEPLEIRLAGASGETRTIAVTMRTPGNDFELAAGFAFSEGIVGDRLALNGVTYCIDPLLDDEQRYNVVSLQVAALPPADAAMERHFTVNSSCGVCGRATLESLEARGVTPVDDDVTVPIETILALPERMRAAQRVFDSTGGLHAAALFGSDGSPIAIREDVGRHNAVDKIVGWGLLERRLPLRQTMLAVSGRTSYEIVQKAACARIPIVCGVSAPSSLAVSLAQAFGITLAGFVRGTRANVYAGAHRIIGRD